jgi:probable HAF family extracellular repeat protein
MGKLFGVLGPKYKERLGPGKATACESLALQGILVMWATTGTGLKSVSSQRAERIMKCGFVIAARAAAISIVAGTSGKLLAAAPSFQGLGFLDAASDPRSEANGVSDDGLVVAGRGSFSTGEAFRWTANDGMTGLGDLAGGTEQSASNAISGDGNVIVGFSNIGSSAAQAFRWTSADGIQGLGYLPGGSSGSTAIGASRDGSVIVGSSTSSSGLQAFRLQLGEGMQGLGDFSGGMFASSARGTSSDGAVVVGQGTTSAGPQAFRWTDATGLHELGDLAGGTNSSSAFGVSGDGAVVVGGSNSASGTEAFRWTSMSEMRGLGDLAGGTFASTATATTINGSIVVGFGTSTIGQEAFIWDVANQMRNLKSVLIDDYGLNLDGWTLTVASGISPSGNAIVGSGINPQGLTEAWIAVVPEPAGMTMVLAAGLALHRRRSYRSAHRH